MKFRFLIWFIFLLCKTVLTQDKDGFCQIENADGQKDNLGKIYIYISVLANQTFVDANVRNQDLYLRFQIEKLIKWPLFIITLTSSFTNLPRYIQSESR